MRLRTGRRPRNILLALTCGGSGTGEGLAGDQCRLLVSVPPTKSALQVTKRQVQQSLSHCRLSLSQTYNSSKGVRVSRSDDTDLDGTTQVPGQSPALTAWLTENLGHPTGEVTTVGIVLLATYTKPHARHTNHVKTHHAGGNIDYRRWDVHGKVSGHLSPS
ncbi:hypothetical protein Taro_009753 [Colocasia esculenta]|uniref:Uncharacterized protein n=1 Tax=Colocasia esculenta TaxID=4460 RepID=A0A843U5Q7_COLES|nr:hypothetical protein [Colocasia esculenta]